MSTPLPGEGIEHLDIPDELDERMQNLDERTLELLQSCSDYLQDPTDSDLADELTNGCDDVSIAFESCLRTICVRATPEESVRLVTGLMMSTETNRINKLIELMPGLRLKPLKSSHMAEGVSFTRANAETDDEFIDQISTGFGGALRGDIRKFVKKIRKDQQKRATGVITIRVSSEPLPTLEGTEQTGEVYAFSLQPRLKKIHNPAFIPGATISYSVGEETFGEIQVPASVSEGMTDEDDIIAATQEHFVNAFERGLSALGQTAIQLMWFRHSIAPEPDPEA